MFMLIHNHNMSACTYGLFVKRIISVLLCGVSDKVVFIAVKISLTDYIVKCCKRLFPTMIVALYYNPRRVA